MADATTAPAAPAATVSDITTAEADWAKLQTLWATANKQYEARKASIVATVDTYVATHQVAASAHNAEIAAANLIKAKIVPVVAATETAASELDQFLLTKPWYVKLRAWAQKNHRLLMWLLGVSALGGIYYFT